MLKSYLMSITSAAILCSILKQIAGKEKLSSGMIKLLSGLFISICVISPWKNFTLDDLKRYNPLSTQDGEVYVEAGKQMTDQQVTAIITEHLEAYILEKANALQLRVEVDVELTEEFIPLCVKITGDISQQEMEELSAFIVREVGIERQMQIWN